MVSATSAVDEELACGGGDVVVEPLEELGGIQRMTGTRVLDQVTHAVRIRLWLDGKRKPDWKLVLNITIVIVIVFVASSAIFIGISGALVLVLMIGIITVIPTTVAKS